MYIYDTTRRQCLSLQHRIRSDHRFFLYHITSHRIRPVPTDRSSFLRLYLCVPSIIILFYYYIHILPRHWQSDWLVICGWRNEMERETGHFLDSNSFSIWKYLYTNLSPCRWLDCWWCQCWLWLVVCPPPKTSWSWNKKATHPKNLLWKGSFSLSFTLSSCSR